MRKERILLLVACTILIMYGMQNIHNAQAKKAANVTIIKKPYVVMEGATREITPDSFKVKYSVNNNKIVSVIKDKPQMYSTVSPKAGAGYTYGILVKGKKCGTTKITFKKAGKKTVYTVKVLSKAFVKKQSKKALNKYIKKYAGKDNCSYMDFNGDGIKEVYHDGKFTYYNYAINKVVTKDAPVTEYDRLYASYKNHLLYAAYNEDDNSTGSYEDDAIDCGRFMLFNEAKVFDFLDYDVRIGKYVKPKEYVGDKYVEGTDYYLLRDSGYDQDDYWYEPYTEEEKEEYVSKNMPDKKEIVIK